MLDAGVAPTTPTFNTLMSACLVAGNTTRMRSYFDVVPSYKLQRTTASWNILLNSMAKAKQLNEAYELLNEMQRDGVKPNTITYTTLIKLFVAKGDMREAMEVLDLM